MTHTEDLDPRAAIPFVPFKAAEALQRGVSRWALRQLVRTGEVRQVLREVYVRAELPDTIELRTSALSLAVSPHAVVCDRTAAWLWGVDALRPWELDLVPRLDAYVLRGRSRIRRPQARGGERDLSPEDIVTLDGIKVTTPLRTSLDLGCGLGRYDAISVMDGFARQHGVGRPELTSLLPRYRGRRGVVQARELVPLVDGRAESAAESFTKLVIFDEGLPAPEPQFWVKVRGVPTYRLDLAYPSLKICVEYDGEEFHSSKAAKERDRKRRAWLRDHGWVVIVVDKDSFKGPALEAWLLELRTAIADRMR